MSNGTIEAASVNGTVNAAEVIVIDRGYKTFYMRNSDGYIQISGDGTEWENVLELKDVKGENGGYYRPEAKIEGNTLTIRWFASKNTMAAATPSVLPLPEGGDKVTAETIKEALSYEPADQEDVNKLFEEIADLKQKTPSGESALTIAQVEALDGMFKKCAFTGDVTAEYTAFKTAFGITESGGEEEPTDKTLTSISATYTGGDVTEGTALTDLTGIAVTGHYSDGSTATVTGYTLSGDIFAGENTITVSYGGKTTTFIVVGIAEASAELPTDGLYGFFDLRNPQTTVGDYHTSVAPLQGSGVGVAYLNTTSNSSAFDEYGLVAGNLWLCDASVYGNEANSKDLGTEFSICMKHYGGIAKIGDYIIVSNIADQYCGLKPKYNTSSGTAIVAQEIVQGSHNDTDYHNINMVVNGETLKFYLDGALIKTYNGSDYDGFVSWYSKNIMTTWYDKGHVTAVAIYTKALNEVEIVEIDEYFKTLEVA